MTNIEDFRITLRDGQVVVHYPDGTSDNTGIFPNPFEAEVIEQFALTTAGRSLLMRMRKREVLDSRTGLLHAEPAKAIIRNHLERLNVKRFEGTVSVIFMDLDHFGKINKTFGTTTGDRVLQWFAELLRRQTRGTDILIRWGGEEFVVFALANSHEKQQQHSRFPLHQMPQEQLLVA